MAIKKEIKDELKKLADEKYREMQKTIIPTVDPDSIIGVRTPELRKMAKVLVKRDDIDEFLSDLPHKSFDENQLHAFVLSEMKDYDACMEKLNTFLPFVDNWATCDQMSPKIFRKHRDELLPYIETWLSSGETYTVRFAVGMLNGEAVVQIPVGVIGIICLVHIDAVYDRLYL